MCPIINTNKYQCKNNILKSVSTVGRSKCFQTDGILLYKCPCSFAYNYLLHHRTRTTRTLRRLSYGTERPQRHQIWPFLNILNGMAPRSSASSMGPSAPHHRWHIAGLIWGLVLDLRHPPQGPTRKCNQGTAKNWHYESKSERPRGREGVFAVSGERICRTATSGQHHWSACYPGTQSI